MLYDFEKGWTAAQSFRSLNELFGRGNINETQIRKWFNCLKSPDKSLKGEVGRGCLFDLMIRLFRSSWKKTEVWQGCWLNNSPSTNPRSSDASKISVRCGKWLNGSLINSPITTWPAESTYRSVNRVREINF